MHISRRYVCGGARRRRVRGGRNRRRLRRVVGNTHRCGRVRCCRRMRRGSVTSGVRDCQQLSIGYTLVLRVGCPLCVASGCFRVTSVLLLIVQSNVRLVFGLGWLPGLYYRRYRHNAVAR